MVSQIKIVSGLPRRPCPGQLAIFFEIQVPRISSESRLIDMDGIVIESNGFTSRVFPALSIFASYLSKNSRPRKVNNFDRRQVECFVPLSSSVIYSARYIDFYTVLLKYNIFDPTLGFDTGAGNFRPRSSRNQLYQFSRCLYSYLVISAA